MEICTRTNENFITYKKIFDHVQKIFSSRGNLFFITYKLKFHPNENFVSSEPKIFFIRMKRGFLHVQINNRYDAFRANN